MKHELLFHVCIFLFVICKDSVEIKIFFVKNPDLLCPSPERLPFHATFGSKSKFPVTQFPFNVVQKLVLP